MRISPLAAIDPRAEIAPDVEIGPFCVIGAGVQIGPGCRLINSVTIQGPAIIGPGNIFHPNAVIGGNPQDRKFKGSLTRLEIGSNNIFRESCTVHRGTEHGGGVTRLGSNNLFMVNVHIGHDAQLGSNGMFANNVMMAGHVHVGDYVAMMGGVGLHHFVTVGDLAYIGGYARIHYDVPPFVKIDGADEIRGANSIGLKRAGFLENDVVAIEDACRRLFYRDRASKPFSVALAEFDTFNGINPHVKKMVEFLRRRDTGSRGRYLETLRTR
jgi:UDP-N-acetylglucosamine acyltransferase